MSEKSTFDNRIIKTDLLLSRNKQRLNKYWKSNLSSIAIPVGSGSIFKFTLGREFSYRSKHNLYYSSKGEFNGEKEI